MELIDGFHEAERISDGAYRIDEQKLANSYLIVGSQKALLIDTGNGAGNLRQCVEQLTDKPVIVAVTHRHPDHTGGAWQFGAYYAHKRDKNWACNLLCRQRTSQWMVKQAGYRVTCKKPLGQRVHVRTMAEGQEFALGGRTIQVVPIPGHTKGSVMFVDDVDRHIYTGDDVNPHLWMHLPGCTSLQEWFAGADRVLAYMEKGYAAFYGHGEGRLSIDQVRQTYGLVQEILAKHRQGELPRKKSLYPDKEAWPNVYYNKKYMDE